jgi:hypothetical protein
MRYRFTIIDYTSTGVMYFDDVGEKVDTTVR